MKFHLFLLGLLLSVTPCLAEFRMWTDSEGRSAKLDLLWVEDAKGETVGEFKMVNGKVVKLKASTLSEKDAKFLKEHEPMTRISGPATAFDELLDHNLESLEGDELVQLKKYKRPKKYYLFYHTAKWCGYCKKYTPSLVDWYEKNKNDNFELVVISSDRNRPDMVKNASNLEMPWPLLKYSEVRTFKSSYKNTSRGIPSLVVYDTQGKLIGQFRSKHKELTELVR